MGKFVSPWWVKAMAWSVAIIIAGLNVYALPGLAKALSQGFAG